MCGKSPNGLSAQGTLELILSERRREGERESRKKRERIAIVKRVEREREREGILCFHVISVMLAMC